jgi:acetyltransferase-like isoleucine patch superfamily enzyme
MREWLQRRAWRRRGYRIAADAQIAPGVVIEGEEVDIAPGVRLLPGTVLRGRRIQLGRRVEIGPGSRLDCPEIVIGEESMIRQNVTVAGLVLPDSRFELGRRVRVFQDAFLNPSKPLVVGDESGVGGRSLIFTHASWQSILEGYPVEFAPITIGRNVWLPWQVFVLPGVEIGDNVTIAAGSVVSRSIPANSLAAGYPARVLRRGDDWPERPSPEAQWEIASRVFRDLAAHWEMRGEAAEVEERDGALVVRLAREDRTRTVALVREGDAPGEAEVAAALRGRPGVAEGQAWLALLDRDRGGPDGPLADEVADFVSRYGLRFQRVDERTA